MFFLHLMKLTHRFKIGEMVVLDVCLSDRIVSKSNILFL